MSIRRRVFEDNCYRFSVQLGRRREENLAHAKRLSANPNRTDDEQALLETLVLHLAGHRDFDGSYPSSSRIGPGRARHYSIIPGGLPGHGKR